MSHAALIIIAPVRNTSTHRVARAIRATYVDQSTLSPEATQALFRSQNRAPELTVDLKDRELQVLELLAKRLTNPQIGEYLSLSVSTIKFCMSCILEKLYMKTRTEAVAWAIHHGLVGKENSAN